MMSFRTSDSASFAWSHPESLERRSENFRFDRLVRQP